jgi:hypothetical protein
VSQQPAREGGSGGSVFCALKDQFASNTEGIGSSLAGARGKSRGICSRQEQGLSAQRGPLFSPPHPYTTFGMASFWKPGIIELYGYRNFVIHTFELKKP